MIGVPTAPNATGAVLASSTTTAARTGENPSAISMTPVIATGGAEPGQRLEQPDEAERDDDRLYPGVVGDQPEGGAQVLEPARGPR